MKLAPHRYIRYEARQPIREPCHLPTPRGVSARTNLPGSDLKRSWVGRAAVWIRYGGHFWRCKAISRSARLGLDGQSTGRWLDACWEPPQLFWAGIGGGAIRYSISPRYVSAFLRWAPLSRLQLNGLLRFESPEVLVLEPHRSQFLFTIRKLLREYGGERLIALNQLAIVFAMLVIYIVNYWVSLGGSTSWNKTTGWRWMFATGIVPSLLLLGLLFFVPETARFLLMHGRRLEEIPVWWSTP